MESLGIKDDYLFQSTLPRGERLQQGDGFTADNIFQSTLPRGERPILPRSLRKQENFNPRSREGSDCSSSSNLQTALKISIHAPARGATLNLEKVVAVCKFQSTLPRGERHHQPVRQAPTLRFQSTLPRGERRRYADFHESGNNFNPRSREGSDRKENRDRLLQLYFNPRSREGSDKKDKKGPCSV